MERGGKKKGKKKEEGEEQKWNAQQSCRGLAVGP